MEKDDITMLPPIVQQYIEAVIRRMGYRRSVQDDVREELTAHFVDALHGCGDEKERQKRAQELIAGFSDVKLLGTLIRRGKKRCRPWWRTMVARVFQTLGVLVLLFILYIAWFFSGKPIITTNYLEVMNNEVRPVADESQNAFPYYQKAIDSYVGYDEKTFEDTLRPVSQLSQPERQILTDWLSRNTDTISLLRQGNVKPYYWRTYSTGSNTTELIALLIPDLKNFKELSSLLCWQALANAGQGNLAEAFDAAFESYNLGMHLRSKNILIEQLVAIAIEARSTQAMRMILADSAGQMDARQLDSVRKSFAQLVSNEGFSVGFEGERLFMLDEIQRSFTQTRLGKSHIYLQRISQLVPMVNDFNESAFVKSWFHILFTHPDRDETVAAADRFYAAMDEYANYSPAELRRRNIDVTEQTMKLTKGNILLNMMLPALEKVIQLSFRNKADSEATLAVMAILQYQKQTGKLPQSLGELVKAGLLQSTPIDPYSDGPLVYRVTDGGFTLYSVGADFEDDGGTPFIADSGRQKMWAESDDTVFWPIK
ncbi:MAG: hypothetical protein LLF76_07040 [Planctomycetaceae bacterium]|nr:hypothetical protein [Planctomycetaceae bacterium]